MRHNDFYRIAMLLATIMVVLFGVSLAFNGSSLYLWFAVVVSLAYFVVMSLLPAFFDHARHPTRYRSRLDNPPKLKDDLVEGKDIIILVEQSLVGNCPVCGDRLVKSIQTCPICKTQHHAQCWDYNEGCAVYACEANRGCN